MSATAMISGTSTRGMNASSRREEEGEGEKKRRGTSRLWVKMKAMVKISRVRDERARRRISVRRSKRRRGFLEGGKQRQKRGDV